MSQSSGSSGGSPNPNTSSQPSNSAAPSNPDPSASSSTAASAFNSVLNHPFWIALIVAIIGGIFTIIAAFIQSLPPTPSAQAPNTPATTVPIITSTTAATSAAVAPTSVSPTTPTVVPATAEAALRAYYNALEKRDIEGAVDLVSFYYLTFSGRTRESVFEDFATNGNRYAILKPRIFRTESLDGGETIRFYVGEGEEGLNPKWITVHRDKEDGKWRVNLDGLVDFRLVAVDPLLKNGVIIQSLRVARFENRMELSFQLNNENEHKVLWSYSNHFC